MDWPWFCDEVSPLVSEDVDELDELSSDDDVDVDASSDEEVDDVEVDELPVELPEADFVDECATPVMNAAVTTTPATAAVPLANAARFSSRSAEEFVSMPNTICRGASARPHSSVKETSSIAGRWFGGAHAAPKSSVTRAPPDGPVVTCMEPPDASALRRASSRPCASQACSR